MAKLKPPFKRDGATTTGNSSQVSDGVAAVLLMKRSIAIQKGLPILGVFSYCSCFPDAQRGMVIAEGHHNVGIQLAREMNHNFLGCAENALGIREWLESKGHQYIVTPEKEGPGCGQLLLIYNLSCSIHYSTEAYAFLKIVPLPIYSSCLYNYTNLERSSFFSFKACMTERIKKAKNLQLLLTGGIGSDHVDLKAAAVTGLIVAEITGSNIVLDLMEMFGTHNQLPRTICALHAKPSYDSSRYGTTIDAL
ncbi:hypothetical protein H5410_051213, partial [Solanum commersonii]